MIHDWEGRVTRLSPHYPPSELSQEANSCYEQLLLKLKNKEVNHLTFDKRKSGMLLHPSLVDQELTLDNPVVKKFLERLKSAPEAEFEALIAESPVLNFMARSEYLQELIECKQHAIGFVESLPVAKAIKIMLKRKGIDTRFYRSTGLDQDDKKNRLDWFKDGSKGPKFLLLTYRSGGTGFSLPEADQVWLIDKDYNPGKIKQAIYRAKRVGHAKVVKVIEAKHPLFSSHHVDAILDNKENFFEFLFGNFNSCQDHFRSWVQFLVGLNYHKILYSRKDKKAAAEDVSAIQDAASTIVNSIPEEELIAGVERVKPQLPPPALPAVTRVGIASRDILRLSPFSQNNGLQHLLNPAIPGLALNSMLLLTV